MHGWETRMLLKYYLERGVSKAELSRRFGVSRRTIHEWVETGQLDRDLSSGGSRYAPRPPVLAPLAVDQAAARCSYDHESGGNPPAAVSTTATNTRRRTSRPVKMSLRANRLLTRRACMAGVLVSRPNRKARCGRTKL